MSRQAIVSALVLSIVLMTPGAAPAQDYLGGDWSTIIRSRRCPVAMDCPARVGLVWDSTNVVDAEVAVITPIALDHQRWLGHSVAEIAGVKSGIIKPGATAVVATQEEDVAEVIAARAGEVNARLVIEVEGGR